MSMKKGKKGKSLLAFATGVCGWSLFAVSCGLAVAAADTPESWRPGERWRGFNMEGYALQGKFSEKIDPQDMAWMRELGFNFIRVMVDYHYLAREDDWTKPDPNRFGFLDRALDDARSNALHVNLCLSIPPGIDYKVTRSKARLYSDEVAQQALVDHWRYIAERYRHIPNADLSFNLYNEPNPDPPGDAYARLVARCARMLDEVNPGRLLVVDGLECGRKPELGVLGLKNVVQSLHAYEPMCISHFCASWVPGSENLRPEWPPMPVVSPVCGDRKPSAARGSIAIRNVPACTLTVEPNLVNRIGELVVKADGRELFRQLYVPAPGADWTNLVARSDGEWAGRPVRPIVVDVPACARLEVGLGKGDWVDLGRLTVAADGKCAEIRPEFNFMRSQMPRRDVWFCGFEGAPVALDEKGSSYTGADFLREYTFAQWDKVLSAGQPVMVGEFGFFNKTPHAIGLAWLEDNLREWKKRNMGWALWNFRGEFGLIDSKRKDAEYVDFHGHKLDVKMYELLKRY